MSIVIQKALPLQAPQGVLAATQVSGEALQLSDKVNQFLLMKQDLDKLGPTIKAADKLQKELQSVADQTDKGQKVVLHGTLGTVTFSDAPDGRQVSDMHGLIACLKAKMGYEGLLGILKINLGDIDKYLAPAESAKFLSSDKPTARRLVDWYITTSL